MLSPPSNVTHTNKNTHILTHALSVAEQTLFSGGRRGHWPPKRCFYQMPHSFLLLKSEVCVCTHARFTVTYTHTSVLRQTGLNFTLCQECIDLILSHALFLYSTINFSQPVLCLKYDFSEWNRDKVSDGGICVKKYEVFVMSAEKESHFILILVFNFKQSN